MRNIVNRMCLPTLILTLLVVQSATAAEKFHRIPIEEYRDKMVGGWIGQMAGVGWGFPTEFEYLSKIIPADEMPVWTPETVNQFNQDDLYVEMTFLKTIEDYGFDVSIRQAGIDFANSEYQLWHANGEGRKLLRRGIAPPDSGHPKFNKHAEDIDYQIEADYAGLIAPGMPNLGIELGDKFGHIVNYGDGVYGGQFISGMYAAAFFETDLSKIIQAGLDCIPYDSLYAECIRDVVAWHQETPDHWEATWQKLQTNWHENPRGRLLVCKERTKENMVGNIDAKFNGAYVVIGLLYGGGDLAQTITIATRCGQDSDCNPASAAGILATTMGYGNIPDTFKAALTPDAVFKHTDYSFTKLAQVCEKLARQAILRAGGRIDKDATGAETLVIPIERPIPNALEQSWEPAPIQGSLFTEKELKQITHK